MVSLLPFLKKLPSLLGKLLIRLHARQNLRPVPERCCVIRLGRLPKDFKEKGKISAIQLTEEFALSPRDRESVQPHLSVWAESLTTPQQAYSFLPENSQRRLVLRLKTKEIRGIVGHSADGAEHPNLLNVIWVHLQELKKCPGSEGHAGIIGLDEQSIPAKLLRKDLRSKLAELASKNSELISEQ